MFKKVLIFLAMAAFAKSQLLRITPIPYLLIQPIILPEITQLPVLRRPFIVPGVPQPTQDLEPSTHVGYSFSYDVNDEFTGDKKHQDETRLGDIVRGSYSFLQPDGRRRIVNYTASDVEGFKAIIAIILWINTMVMGQKYHLNFGPITIVDPREDNSHQEGAFSLAGDLMRQGRAYHSQQITAPGHYNFSYGVHDALSGDDKDQEEVRDTNSVRGRYTSLLPGGNRLTVEYKSTKSGFIPHVVLQ